MIMYELNYILKIIIYEYLKKYNTIFGIMSKITPMLKKIYQSVLRILRRFFIERSLSDGLA